MLLIVTHELDVHADAVIAALRRAGFDDILRLDLETAGTRFAFDIHPALGEFALRSRDVPDRLCHQDNLTTIWWRRAGRLGESGRSLAPTPDTVDATETYFALKWLLETRPEAQYPLGHPNAMRSAENKFLQLQVAAELGFSTPPTLFTNDRGRLAEFARTDLVLKPLKTSYVYQPEDNRSISLYAHACEAGQALEMLDGEDSFALYCQARIRKVADIRVNVVPSKTVACRIASASLGSDTVDWRPATMDLEHEIIPIPLSIERKCRAFLERMGLKWGAFDFGQMEDGSWVFFECNPNGQWLWIETKTGFPLADLFAHELIRHHQAKNRRIQWVSLDAARMMAFEV